MTIRSKNSIIKTIRALAESNDVDGVVRVVVSEDENSIDISFDNRKYIGRLNLRWTGTCFYVYLMDKAEGKVGGSTYIAAKSVYLTIKDSAGARKFVKWYELTTQLAAMRRPRKVAQ